MCLIIAQTIGAEPIPATTLLDAWQTNNDGAGIMYVVDGKLVIEKPFFKLRKLREAYNRIHATYGNDSPIVVHFRWATHGGKTAVNIHPHPLAGGEVGLAHNGILSNFLPSVGADISDTVFFCRTVLMGRTPAQLLDAEFGKALAEMIGTGNKFVMLGADKTLSIVNEDQGTWIGDSWYSNTHWDSTLAIWKPIGKKWNLPPVSTEDTLPAMALTEDEWPTDDSGRPLDFDEMTDEEWAHAKEIVNLMQSEDIADLMLWDEAQEFDAALRRDGNP